MIITATSLAALTTGFHSAYTEAFSGVTPLWSQIATEVPSTTKSNTYAWLGTWPKLREWFGDREVNNLEAHGYSILNRKFESTVGVAADDIEDDEVGVYKPQFSEMGRAAAEHPDEIVFEALRNGFTAKGYDNVPFFGNHKVGKATVSNLQAGDGPAWYLLDCSRSLKPFVFQKRRDYRFAKKDDPNKSDHVFNTDTFLYGVDARVNAGYGFWQMAFASRADLTRENLRAAISSMSELTDAKGRKLNLRATHLVAPTGLEFVARDLVLASVNAAGATNTDYNIVKIIATPLAA